MLRRRVDHGPTYDAATVQGALDALAALPETPDAEAVKAYKAATKGLPALFRYGPILGADRELTRKQLEQLLEGSA